MKAQPIETAPQDGTPILTDVGIVRKIKWLHVAPWVHSSVDGYAGRKGAMVSFANPQPTMWVPLPVLTLD